MKYLYKIFTVKSSSVLPNLLGTGAELQKEKKLHPTIPEKPSP